MIGWSQQNIDAGFAFFSSIQDIFPDADMRFVFLLFFYLTIRLLACKLSSRASLFPGKQIHKCRKSGSCGPYLILS